MCAGNTATTMWRRSSRSAQCRARRDPRRGPALNFTYAETDVVAKLVPGTPHITLDEALKVSPQLREMYEGDERVQTLIDTARALEGMPRNTSTHAAGVVITRLPVYDYVPLATNDDTIVTEYTMTTLERLGLLKVDFLGLRNITVIDDAIQEIRKTDPDFSMARVTDNDPKVMDMLTQGKTSGVFQMESSGMTGVCVGLKPQSIEDLSIIVAAYRPGPMDSIPRLIACKSDPKLVQYKHPMLEPILSVTYGCILYQEQVIEIFRKLAGYSLGQADMVRRAMSKKKVKDIEKSAARFSTAIRRAALPAARPTGFRSRLPRTSTTRCTTLRITPLTRPIRSAMRSSRIRRRGSNITIRRNIWRR